MRKVLIVPFLLLAGCTTTGNFMKKVGVVPEDEFAVAGLVLEHPTKEQEEFCHKWEKFTLAVIGNSKSEVILCVYNGHAYGVVKGSAGKEIDPAELVEQHDDKN